MDWEHACAGTRYAEHEGAIGKRGGKRRGRTKVGARCAEFASSSFSASEESGHGEGVGRSGNVGGDLQYREVRGDGSRKVDVVSQTLQSVLLEKLKVHCNLVVRVMCMVV